MTWNEQTDGQAGGQMDGAQGQPIGVTTDHAQLQPVQGMPVSGPVNPLIQQGQPAVSQPAVALGAGMPTAPLQAPASAVPDDDSVDDAVWVNRAKRIIAGTKGDPHRQVQLLQQLSVVYLKERYGRSVHADEV